MQLKLLAVFCEANGIGIEIPEVSPSLKADTTFRVPSSALKHFCGQEMMTSRGKMQPSAALEYIMTYAKRNDLLSSTAIVLDDNLHDIFNRHGSIPCTELPIMINALFTD